AGIRISTPVTPPSAPTASSACDLKRSRTGQAGVVSSKVKLTFPSRLTSSSLIMPRLTTSRPRSGSLIVDRASRTCCEDGTVIGSDVTDGQGPSGGSMPPCVGPGGARPAAPPLGDRMLQTGKVRQGGACPHASVLAEPGPPRP